MLGPNPKRNSRGPSLKNLVTVEDTEKTNYECLPTVRYRLVMDKERGHFLTSRIILRAQNRGPNPFRLVIAPSQPFPVSHCRCHYPRRSAGEAAEPMPSTVIPSFIPNATGTGWVNLRLSIGARGARQGFHRRRRGCVSRRARVAAFPDIFVVHATNVLHVRQGGRPVLEESSHPKPSTYTIPYHFSPKSVPAPNGSCIAWLNSGLSRTKAPSFPIFNVSPLAAIPSRSLSEGIIATGKAVVVVDWTCRSSGSNNPSVQSKVAPDSDQRRIDGILFSNLQLTVKIGNKCLE
ncbi:hypothetical protein BU17DRAFT_60061 [Hysterangium stoloniferum]|nr:hypothetical protein BU17DRAFT_60061 [Hysterangium stoloniferum]